MTTPSPLTLEQKTAARYAAKVQAIFETAFLNSITEWLVEQRAAVWSEGNAAGRRDQETAVSEVARQQGHKEGFDIGRAQGFAQGYIDGEARGYEQGLLKAAAEAPAPAPAPAPTPF